MICTVHWETPKNCPESILSSVGWGGRAVFSFPGQRRAAPFTFASEIGENASWLKWPQTEEDRGRRENPRLLGIRQGYEGREAPILHPPPTVPVRVGPRARGPLRRLAERNNPHAGQPSKHVSAHYPSFNVLAPKHHRAPTSRAPLSFRAAGPSSHSGVGSHDTASPRDLVRRCHLSTPIHVGWGEGALTPLGEEGRHVTRGIRLPGEQLAGSATVRSDSWIKGLRHLTFSEASSSPSSLPGC